jgi:hypothetical protein
MRRGLEGVCRYLPPIDELEQAEARAAAEAWVGPAEQRESII